MKKMSLNRFTFDRYILIYIKFMRKYTKRNEPQIRKQHLLAKLLYWSTESHRYLLLCYPSSVEPILTAFGM